ncbi:MAG: glycerol kinase GlpK [Maricaulaceae bacterium]
MSRYILVIDEGTTSTRAIAYDRDFLPAASAHEEVALSFPANGWVEQDAEDIWSATRRVSEAVIDRVGGVEAIAAIGIANQRETTLVWDRVSGRAIHPAIIWQDRRTGDLCDRMRADGVEADVQSRTGLLLDPYFSATKIGWLLDTVDGARAGAERGALAFGTVDAWLIWKLTGGRVHACDVTNASRTLLMELQTGQWSPDLLTLFGVPRALLPDIQASGAAFGVSDPEVFGKALPILSALGDQQAALVGQACLRPGEAKITLGTGAFLVANTGGARVRSAHRLLATPAYEFDDGTAAFALEGAIFNAGTVVKWLRDELNLIDNAADSERLAAALPDNGGVYFIPAFTGMGAPHWRSDVRGQITGLSRGARSAHIVRAGLEACAYQTRDLLRAFAEDGAKVTNLRVDGGMAANDWLMQFIADICEVQVERPDNPEMTALGAAATAAFQLGWSTPADWGRRSWTRRRFEPQMPGSARETLLAGWDRAVSALF